ncbi:condensation domain-containing protein [Actinophytocola xanthii]|uniref:Condensation domain-containing protein n=1 Tax=Actinophytocola xanthii TaxID=1912961 RepID=A0A1Q8CVX2_9PSEU|nr:condensation domain-containing protein [Actinophytocola xanthii]OLF18503.1 hypothetical protein BU204_05990 [Actinophytocola xanthii]
MRAEELGAVLLDALRGKAAGKPVSTARSWAQNGGTSLEAYAAVMRIEQELGLVVPVARVLGPLPLTEVIEQALTTPAPEASRLPASGGTVPATASQRRHWRHAQGEGSAAFLNMGHALFCRRDFDPDRAEAAFRAVVARHEALRNRYVLDRAGTLLLEEVADWPERASFTRHPRSSSVERATELVRADVARPFPLGQEPPVRGGCVPLDDDTEDATAGAAIVYFCVHHITADGWSVDLLAGDFLALYAGTPELPAATPFSHYAAALDARARAGVYAEDVDYWRAKFARVSPDFTIAAQDGEAAGQRAASARLAWDGPGEAEAVRAAARALGVTTYSLLLSALLAAAHVLSGAEDVVVMSGVANRNRADHRDTVGLFTNQIFFVGHFPDDATASETVGDHVRRVHADVVESLARSELPVEVVLDELGAYAAARTLAPYANILFQAAQAPIDPPAIRDGSWRAHPLGTGSIKRHCNLHLVDTPTELALDLAYSIALVGERDATRLLRAVRAAVDHVQRAVASPVAELVATVRDAVQRRETAPTVFTLDYPGARAEPALAPVLRERFGGLAVVELPVPRSLAEREIEDCRRRCGELVRRAEGPALVVAYCSAAAWGHHLVAELGETAVLLTVSGTVATERSWVEEFAVLVRRFDEGIDLSTVEQKVVAGSPAERRAAAEDVLAEMRRLLTSAMTRRFGDPLGRVARETMEVQLSWLAYLGCCVALGPPPGRGHTEELHLSGTLADAAEELEDGLAPLLERLGHPATAGAEAR